MDTSEPGVSVNTGALGNLGKSAEGYGGEQRGRSRLLRDFIRGGGPLAPKAVQVKVQGNGTYIRPWRSCSILEHRLAAVEHVAAR